MRTATRSRRSAASRPSTATLPERAAGAAVVAALGLLALARPVAAHGATTRFDASVPLPLVVGGAASAVALTAVVLARAGRVPTPTRTLVSLPTGTVRVARGALRVGFLLLVAAAVGHGLVGPRAAGANLATLFVWPVWVEGVAVLSVLVGTPWRWLAPWRVVYDALATLEGGDLGVREYPERLGHWPALAGLLLLGVVAELTVVPDRPAATAGVVAAYALGMLAGALVFGPTWLDRADPLRVLYAVLGRASPVVVEAVDRPGSSAGDESARSTGRRRGATDPAAYAVRLRTPWAACRRPVADDATAAFVVAAVYVVTADGVVGTAPYRALLTAVGTATGLGDVASVGLYLVGYVAFLAAAVVAARAVAQVADVATPLRAFAASAAPIAAGYHLAHNWTYVLGGVGRLPAAVEAASVDPLYWLPVGGFWASQVALVVLGHVVAVVAAHGVARQVAGPQAARAHGPVAALMVGFTALSLWVVSLPVA